MKNKLLKLSILLYKNYKKIFWPITIFGFFFWLLGKLCWINIITFHYICDYALIYDAIAHILFGIWVFISTFIFCFFIVKLQMYTLRQMNALISVFIFTIIFAFIVNCTNEFPKKLSKDYNQKALENDELNTFFDISGNLFIIIFSIVKVTHYKRYYGGTIKRVIPTSS